MAVVYMSKEKTRKEKLSERASLPEDLRETKSHEIRQKLSKLPEFIDAKSVFIYVSANNEVDTEPIIMEMLKAGKRVLVPAIDAEKREIIASELLDFEELGRGMFGIMEPKKEFLRRTPTKKIDIAIIPGIAFDKNGNRIGYGHGYFDRFLKNVESPIVALAYDFQLVPRITPDIYDIKVNKILTESKVVRCGK